MEIREKRRVVSDKANMPDRPLGLVRALVERAGLSITHAYEDLVFIEHNAILLRMKEQRGQVSIIFNEDSEEDKRKTITDQFISIGRDIEIEIMPSGTYRLTPDASTETLQFEFFV